MARKQLEIAGTERESNTEIDAAAEAYVEQRDKRMKLTEKEVEAKESLIEVMRKAGLTVYRDDNAEPPLLVTLKDGKATVKVEEMAGELADEESSS